MYRYGETCYCMILSLVYLLLRVSGVFKSIFKQEFQNRGSDSNTIMRNVRTLYGFVELLIREYSLFVSQGEELRHDLTVKFGVSLDCDQFSRNIHSLYDAARRGAEWCDFFGVCGYNVFVHLL